MKKLGSLIVGISLTGPLALATNAPSKCQKEAIRNVEAVSAIMYSSEKGLNSKETKVVSSSADQLTFEIETYAKQTDPLHCTYSVQMEKNVLGDCWMTRIEQTECGG